jgi:hypothetical protein
VFCINAFFTVKYVACAWLIMNMIRQFLVPFKQRLLNKGRKESVRVPRWMGLGCGRVWGRYSDGEKDGRPVWSEPPLTRQTPQKKFSKTCSSFHNTFRGINQFCPIPERLPRTRVMARLSNLDFLVGFFNGSGESLMPYVMMGPLGLLWAQRSVLEAPEGKGFSARLSNPVQTHMACT